MDSFKSYMEAIKEFGDFRKDPARTSTLVARMRTRDPEAKEELILSTLKFVASLAKVHCKRMGAWRDFDDLVQEGNEKVLVSIHHFDPARSASLEGFLRSRVKFAFIDYWYERKVINQTGYRRQLERLIKRARAELTAALRREPTAGEIAGQLEMDERRMQEYLSQGPISLVGVGEPEGDNEPADVVLIAPPSANKSPLAAAELAELPDIAVRCLGRENADLLLAYIEHGGAYFQEIYFIYKHKRLSAANARQYKARLVRRLRDCLRRMSKHSGRGGNHEPQATSDRQVTQRIFNG
jgi:RNA polymerase sigma factor (sigma-70 family)